MELTMEQGTQDWLEARKGKFTSSEVFKLMGARGLGKTGETYVYDKVGESLSSEVKDEVFSKAMQWGTDHEPVAKKFLTQIYGWEIIESGFTQSELELFGGSLDGFERLNNAVIEIKCPYNTGNHVKNAIYSRDVKTMKKELPAYYWQIVGNCYVIDTNKAFFVTFDPRINSDSGLVVNELKIPAEDIELLKERLAEASELFNNILTNFNNEK